jgi:hypothetical protein
MDQDPQLLGNQLLIAPQQLLIAAQNGNDETVKALLAQGASVDTKDIVGSTPLILAAGNGHEDVCKLLLTHNAQVDAKNNYGFTPLMCASLNDHEDVCKLLLTHNAQVDAKDNAGSTPLILAAINHYEDVCKCLIDAMILKQYNFTKNIQAIIIVLGMRKKNGYLRLIGHDMVLCIARMVFNMAKQEDVNVVEQINAIDNEALKIELLNYFQTQLSILQGAQPKE